MMTKTALTASLRTARKTPTEAHHLVKEAIGDRWNQVRCADGDMERIEAAMPVAGYKAVGDPDWTRYELADGSAVLTRPGWYWEYGVHRTWLADADFVREWGDDDSLPAGYHDSHERFAYPK